MIDPRESDFLDLLYGAALEPELWVPAMERFADMIGGSSAWLSQLDIADGTGSGLGARLDPAMAGVYLQHFAGQNPLNNVKDPQRYIAVWDARIITDEDWMRKEDLRRTEYYNDFLTIQDVHSTLMIRLTLEGRESCVLNVNRPERRGQFEGADIERAGYYHPHLIRAFRLSQKFVADRNLADPALSGFEDSPQALFLLGLDGRVVRVNPAAERLVARGGLSLTLGRLTAPLPDAARRLAGLIGAASPADGGARIGGSASLQQPNGRLPLSVAVAPIGLERWSLFARTPSVLVRVTDPEAGLSLPEHTMRNLFGLTGAESRVAQAMFAGGRPQDAAATLGVSVNTLRTHLKRIFEKTGVNRQSALIGLMMRVADLGTG